MERMILTEAETSGLIRCSDGRPVSLAFGPCGVWLKDVPENEWAKRLVTRAREEIDYRSKAHEHDF